MTGTTSHDRSHEPCDDYVGLLVRAADDSLDADGRARLDAHLPGCGACRAALDSQHIAYVALSSTFEVEPSLGFATRVVANVEPRDSWLDRLDFRRWTWRVSPIAAGLFLAAWVVTDRIETASAFESVAVVNAADAGVQADAVRWSDAVDGTDLVSLTWDAEVAGTPATGILEETPQ
ncbi:MAG: zf-HC2 domain-containing protein [Acidobacteria bacterium]|nr:zf-HC2 domain-containing protein [Acidobacteriota bacterium]